TYSPPRIEHSATVVRIGRRWVRKLVLPSWRTCPGSRQSTISRSERLTRPWVAAAFSASLGAADATTLNPVTSTSAHRAGNADRVLVVIALLASSDETSRSACVAKECGENPKSFSAAAARYSRPRSLRTRSSRGADTRHNQKVRGQAAPRNRPRAASRNGLGCRFRRESADC